MAAAGLAAPVAITPVRERRGVMLLVALGLAVATQAALAHAYGSAPGAGRDSWPAALMLFLFLSLPGAGVIWATWAARDMQVRWPLALCIAMGGLLMRLPYFGAGPMLEDDHFRYLLDGAMVANAANPYTHAPDALMRGVANVPPALIEAGRDVIASVNFPDLRSIYPGAAQVLFVLSHLIAPWDIDGIRLVVFLAEALTAAMIWRALSLSGRPALLVALYWCNPLMAFSLTGQAHIDAALAPALLAAFFAVHRGAALRAGLFLGAAAGVKLWPILLAPLLAQVLWPDRRRLARFTLALGLTTLVLCGPLLIASLGAKAGLTAYAGGWSVNNAPYAWASYLFLHLLGPGVGEAALRALVALAAVTASLVIAARRSGGLDDLIGRAAILAAMLFYLSPAQFPWYSAWFVPLAAATGKWALVSASVGLPIYFFLFPLAISGFRDVHGYGLAFLHLAPVLLSALLLRGRPSSGGAA